MTRLLNSLIFIVFVGSVIAVPPPGGSGVGVVGQGNFVRNTSGFTSLATDNFNRSESLSASPNWTVRNTWNLNGTVCTNANLAGDNWARYSSITWPNDQYAQAKVSVTGTGLDTGYGVAVRVDTGNAGNYYRCVVSHNANSVKIDKMTANAGSTLATIAVTWVDGDVLKMSIVGTTITIYQNGVSIGSTTDATWASGQAGLAYSSTATDGNLDDFDAGSVP